MAQKGTELLRRPSRTDDPQNFFKTELGINLREGIRKDAGFKSLASIRCSLPLLWWRTASNEAGRWARTMPRPLKGPRRAQHLWFCGLITIDARSNHGMLKA